MPVHSKEDIAAALNEKVNAFTSFIQPLTLSQFEERPGDKWSAGQNLDHLVKAIKPLQLPFLLPKFLLKMLFGKANRPSKSYEELVTKYKNKLAAGGRASAPFVPPIIIFENKNLLLQTYLQQKEKLIRKILRQNEEELDQYILPHPLLGKITLREILFFTIYHNQHHLESLQERK